MKDAPNTNMLSKEGHIFSNFHLIPKRNTLMDLYIASVNMESKYFYRFFAKFFHERNFFYPIFKPNSLNDLLKIQKFLFYLGTILPPANIHYPLISIRFVSGIPYDYQRLLNRFTTNLC